MVVCVLQVETCRSEGDKYSAFAAELQRRVDDHSAAVAELGASIKRVRVKYENFARLFDASSGAAHVRDTALKSVWDMSVLVKEALEKAERVAKRTAGSAAAGAGGAAAASRGPSQPAHIGQLLANSMKQRRMHVADDDDDPADELSD
jgi:hypothetical protein